MTYATPSWVAACEAIVADRDYTACSNLVAVITNERSSAHGMMRGSSPYWGGAPRWSRRVVPS